MKTTDFDDITCRRNIHTIPDFSPLVRLWPELSQERIETEEGETQVGVPRMRIWKTAKTRCRAAGGLRDYSTPAPRARHATGENTCRTAMYQSMSG